MSPPADMTREDPDASSGTERLPYRHAPSRGNHVELLAGGSTFYPRIEEDIDAARHEVLLGTYLWEPDATGRRFLAAARRAAERGVHVCVLLDGIGGRRVDIEDLDAVRKAGGSVGIYHAFRFPLFDSRLMRRFHRKLLVIDGTVAYTGGAGFADGWTARPPREWWDVMVRVTGPVLPLLRTLFGRDWKKASRGQELPPMPVPPSGPVGDETLQALETRRSQPELLRRLVHAVRNARRSVCLANAYFVPGFRLRQALRRAGDRGVDVRLVLPGKRTDHFAVWTAGRRHYHRLLLHGVRIYEFQRSMLHSKYAIVDDWGYVGSSNLDSWSGRFNLELDLGVTSPRTLAQLAGQFEADVAAGREITVRQWEARPLSLRLAETFFGWFDPLL